MSDIDEIVKAKINVETQIQVKHSEDGSEISDGVFKELLFRTKILDAKEFSKFVKSVEKLIRTSDEYKNFIFKVHNELNMKECAVLGKVGEEGDQVSIEVDHYPFTLFDICATVTNKYIAENTPFNTFMIAHDVMKLHFDMKVGFVNLSKTMHELRHSGKIFISLKQVCGRYMEFAKEYADFIEPEVVANLSKLIELTKKNTPISDDPKFLSVRSQDFYDPEEKPVLALENH